VRRLFDRREYAGRVIDVYRRVLSGRETLRVLFADHSVEVGGAQRSLLELMRSARAHCDAHLACPEGPLAEAARAAGVAVLPIPASQPTFRFDLRETPRQLARAGRGGLVLGRHVARVRPHVVHANSLRAGLLAAGSARRTPIVVHCRDFLPPTPSAAVVKRVLLSRSRAVVAVSRQVAERFAGPTWAKRDVVVVDNPVDFDRFDPARVDGESLRRELGLRDGPVLGVIAQITQWKGQDRAIRVLDRLRRTHPGAGLLIVGEAKFVTAATRFDNRAYERELHELAARLGLGDAVHFLGEREDPERVLAALDVLLVPSTEEPFGRTVAEAMAMGVPVVATDAGGPAETIRPGVDGELLPHDDVAGWTEAVGRLAARGRTDSRAYAMSRFSPEEHAARMLDAFRRAAGVRSAPAD
jgi:glycosyltransferase involved in cell wall biosynthesis